MKRRWNHRVMEWVARKWLGRFGVERLTAMITKVITTTTAEAPTGAKITPSFTGGKPLILLLAGLLALNVNRELLAGPAPLTGWGGARAFGLAQPVGSVLPLPCLPASPLLGKCSFLQNISCPNVMLSVQAQLTLGGTNVTSLLNQKISQLYQGKDVNVQSQAASGPGAVSGGGYLVAGSVCSAPGTVPGQVSLMDPGKCGLPPVLDQNGGGMLVAGFQDKSYLNGGYVSALACYAQQVSAQVTQNALVIAPNSGIATSLVTQYVQGWNQFLDLARQVCSTNTQCNVPLGLYCNLASPGPSPLGGVASQTTAWGSMSLQTQVNMDRCQRAAICNLYAVQQGLQAVYQWLAFAEVEAAAYLSWNGLGARGAAVGIGQLMLDLTGDSTHAGLMGQCESSAQAKPGVMSNAGLLRTFGVKLWADPQSFAQAVSSCYKQTTSGYPAVIQKDLNLWYPLTAGAKGSWSCQ